MELYDPYYKLKKMQEKRKAFKRSAESEHFRGFAKYLVEGFSDASESVGQLMPRLEDLSDLLRLLLASYDFIRIPFKYLRAYFSGQPRPFKFTTLGKFVYSFLVLGLAITMLLIHPALPLLAAKLLIVMSAITFVWSFYQVAKMIVMSGKYTEQKAQAEEELAELLEERARIQTEAHKLEFHYAAHRKSFYNHTELAGLDEVYTDISNLFEKYEATNKGIEQLEKTIEQLDRKLSRKGKLQLMDKTVSLALAAASVLGFSLFLLMPPLSLVIIKAVLITSIAYITVRFVIPTLFILSRLAFNKLRSSGAKKDPEPVETDSKAHGLDSSVSAHKLMPAHKTMSKVETPKTRNSKAPQPKPIPPQEDDEGDAEGDKEDLRPSRHG